MNSTTSHADPLTIDLNIRMFRGYLSGYAPLEHAILHTLWGQVKNIK